jgi:hypothetical protein
VLHARNAARAALPAAEAVVVGDVSTIAAMRGVAERVGKLGRFDAVIHNVAVGYREARRELEACRRLSGVALPD